MSILNYFTSCRHLYKKGANHSDDLTKNKRSIYAMTSLQMLRSESIEQISETGLDKTP